MLGGWGGIAAAARSLASKNGGNSRISHTLLLVGRANIWGDCSSLGSCVSPAAGVRNMATAPKAAPKVKEVTWYGAKRSLDPTAPSVIRYAPVSRNSAVWHHYPMPLYSHLCALRCLQAAAYHTISAFHSHGGQISLVQGLSRKVPHLWFV
jgi:hypothetical protein